MKTLKTPPTNMPSLTRFTALDQKKVIRRIGRLFVNQELTAYLNEVVCSVASKDKLTCLYWLRKVVIQTPRKPDADHYQAFKDEYEELLSAIAQEQEQYEPIRWLDAEIDYLQNTTPILSKEDVKAELHIMQDAQQRLSKQWLTYDEMLTLFAISKSTLNRRISEGMPVIKKGRSRYFNIDEVSGWLKKEVA
jgi:hypothetical protein